MALGLILAGSTGCSDNEEIPEPQPLPVEFKLESKTVFVSCDGDEQSVNYTVENGLKNATIKVTADKEWTRPAGRRRQDNVHGGAEQ